MALPASDDFAGSGALSASWTDAAQSGQVVVRDSGTARTNGGDASNDIIAFWNADVFSNDQYSKAVISAMGGGNHYAEVYVRCQGTGAAFDGYEGGTNGTDTFLAKFVNGAFTKLVDLNGVVAFTVTDTIEIRVSGTTVSLYKNGSLAHASATTTDAAIASGAAGIGFYNDVENGTATLTSWEADNLAGGGGGVSIPVVQHHRMRNF